MTSLLITSAKSLVWSGLVQRGIQWQQIQWWFVLTACGSIPSPYPIAPSSSPTNSPSPKGGNQKHAEHCPCYRVSLPSCFFWQTFVGCSSVKFVVNSHLHALGSLYWSSQIQSSSNLVFSCTSFEFWPVTAVIIAFGCIVSSCRIYKLVGQQSKK